MRYITVKEASEKWGITTRQICKLCSRGRIAGAEKRSKVWMIPANAKKPEDGRKTETSSYVEPALLLLNTDYLVENNICNDEGGQSICESQRLYLEGDFKKAYETINSFLTSCDNESYAFVANMIKMLLLVKLGKKDEFESLAYLMNKKVGECKKQSIEHLIYLSYLGKEMDFDDFPKGEEIQFELLPLFAFFEAKKELNSIIKSDERKNIFSLEIICDSLVEKNCPLILAYYHIVLAVYYNALAETNAYMHHIKKAVNILLPRGWYIPLAEYSATIDLSFIKNIDEKAYYEIMDFSKSIIMNYIKMGVFDDICLSPRLSTVTNIQVAFKLVQGKNNSKIAEELGISQYKVKQHIEDLFSITGLTSKKDIKKFFLKNFIL